MTTPAAAIPLTREDHNQRIDALTRLLSSDGWVHVATRLRRCQDEIVTEVMATTTPPEKVPALCSLHAEIDTILAIPDTDWTISQWEITVCKGKPTN